MSQPPPPQGEPLRDMPPPAPPVAPVPERALPVPEQGYGFTRPEAATSYIDKYGTDYRSSFGRSGPAAPPDPTYVPPRSPFYSAPLIRPATVSTGAAMVWLGSAAVILMAAMTILYSDRLVAEAGLDRADVNALRAMALLLIILPVIASVLAAVAFSGSRWGAILSMAPAGAAIVVGTLMASTAAEPAGRVVAGVVIAWSLLACVLLLTRSARRWYDARALHREGARL